MDFLCPGLVFFSSFQKPKNSGKKLWKKDDSFYFPFTISFMFFHINNRFPRRGCNSMRKEVSRMSRFDGWDGWTVTSSHFWQFQPQEVFFWKIL